MHPSNQCLLWTQASRQEATHTSLKLIITGSTQAYATFSLSYKLLELSIVTVISFDSFKQQLEQKRQQLQIGLP